jgi:hypothetical protein
MRRFISTDKKGIDGGANLYMYANLNPNAYSDPFGLEARDYSNPFMNFPGVSLYSGVPQIGWAGGLLPFVGDIDTLMSDASWGWKVAAIGSIALDATGIGLIPGTSTSSARIGIKYIGKMDDLGGIPRSQTLLDDLPDLGSAKANYYQNSSVLRGAVRDGYEIRDASFYRPNSAPDSTLLRPDRTVGQSFLGAERLIMDNKGFVPNAGGVYIPR